MKRTGRNQYTKDRDTTSPTRTRTNQTHSNSSGEETKLPTKMDKTSMTATSKPSPTPAQEIVSTTTKGKGRGAKGKSSKPTGASDSDSKKDKGKDKDKDNRDSKDNKAMTKVTELTLKDMDKATQYMLDFIGKNVPEQRIVEGTSMLGRGVAASSASSSAVHKLGDGQIKAQKRSGQGGIQQQVPEQMHSGDIAEKLRRGIADFRAQFLDVGKVGGLTVS